MAVLGMRDTQQNFSEHVHSTSTHLPDSDVEDIAAHRTGHGHVAVPFPGHNNGRY